MSTIELDDRLRASAPHAPERLRARVLALEPAPRRARTRALVVVLAAVALAVGAAVVEGFVRSGGGTPAPTVRGAVPAREKALVPVTHAAGGSGGAPTSTTAASARAAVPPLAGSSRLQKTDAWLQVRVADVHALSRATTRATQVATSLGGYAQSVVYSTPQGGGGSASLALRVPTAEAKTAIARLGALGTLLGQQISVEDLQHELADESAQIAQLRRTIAALEKALADPTLPDAQKVLLRIRLAEARRSLSQRLNARGGTISAATSARISLELTTRASVAPIVHRPGRLGRMLHSAVGFLGLEGTIALYALIVAGPILLVAIVAWRLARLRRRRGEDDLLAARPL